MATEETSTTPTKAYSTPVKRSAANADAGPSRRPQGASPAYVRDLTLLSSSLTVLILRAPEGIHYTV